MEYLLPRWSILLSILIAGVAGDAVLSGAPVNVSALLGNSASFTCGVTGSQQLGEDLQFYKTFPAPSQLIALNTNLRNTSLYNVTGTYTYTVISVLIEDEGKYECVLFPNTLGAYLSVSVAPASMSLSWPGGNTHVQKATLSNLTCTSKTSRPPATHRWFKGSNDITDQATQLPTTTNSEGYGDAVSYVPLTLTDADYYAPMRCVADVPGAPDVMSAEIRVLFSGSQRLCGGILLAIVSIIFSLMSH